MAKLKKRKSQLSNIEVVQYRTSRGKLITALREYSGGRIIGVRQINILEL